MDFFGLNRYVERILHDGDSPHVRSVYETNFNGFVSESVGEESINNVLPILDETNSVYIGDLVVSDEKDDVIFRPASQS